MGGLQVGPIIRADGTARGDTRVGQDNAQIVSPGHGDYFEQSIRGALFSIQTPVAGVTIAAGMVGPPAAAAATFLSLYNPVGSGLDLEVLLAFLQHISGTPAAGAWQYSVASAIGGNKITANQNVVPTPGRANSGGSRALGYSNTALTGGPAHVAGPMAPFGLFAGAIAVGQPLQQLHEVKGSITVEPGNVLTLAPPGAGTTHIVAGTLWFAETQRPGGK